MKKRFFLIASVLALSNEALIAQQGITGNPPANINATSNPIIRDLTERAWYRGGNQPGGAGGSNNIFGTMWNSPIYTVTNGVNRMVLMGANPTGSISGSLGLGTNLTSPLAKLHISDFGTNTTFDAQGRMFRTDGLVSVQNNWSIWTGNTPASATQKFRISTMANSGAVEIGTVQSGLLHLITNNQRRITILGNSVFPFNRTGFVGLNNQSPLFHLDVNTQNPNDGGNSYTLDHRKLICLIT